MSAIIRHRKQHKQQYADEGVKLTFTSYFVKAAAAALVAVPEVNARFHDDALELFHDLNIGVGTALGNRGLIVPVIQQVQNKSLMEISRELHDQTTRARAGELGFRRCSKWHIHHLESRCLGQPVRSPDHHQPAASGNTRYRQDGESAQGG